MMMLFSWSAGLLTADIEFHRLSATLTVPMAAWQWTRFVLGGRRAEPSIRSALGGLGTIQELPPVAGCASGGL